MTRLGIGAIAVALVALAACGDDESPRTQEVDVSDEQALADFTDEFERVSGLTVPNDGAVVDTAAGEGMDYTLELSLTVPSDDVDRIITETGFGATVTPARARPYVPWRVEALGSDLAPSDTRQGSETYDVELDGRERRRYRQVTVRELGDGTSQLILITGSTP